jgi:hypothetical protein
MLAVEPPGCRLYALGVDVGQHDLRAGGGQAGGDLESESLGRSRHDGNSARGAASARGPPDLHRADAFQFESGGLGGQAGEAGAPGLECRAVGGYRVRRRGRLAAVGHG